MGELEGCLEAEWVGLLLEGKRGPRELEQVKTTCRVVAFAAQWMEI